MTVLVEAKNKMGAISKTFNNVFKVELYPDEVILTEFSDEYGKKEHHLFTRDFDVVVTKRFN